MQNLAQASPTSAGQEPYSDHAEWRGGMLVRVRSHVPGIHLLVASADEVFREQPLGLD